MKETKDCEFSTAHLDGYKGWEAFEQTLFSSHMLANNKTRD